MAKLLKIVGAVIGLVVLLIGGLFVYGMSAWDNVVRPELRELTAPSDAATLARGEHLYRDSLVCWQCHGGEGDRLYPSSEQSGGRVFDMTGVGPGFGFAYGSNLTADKATGLGAWSDGQIVRAFREGVDQDGRLLFPIMESQMYQGISDEDALAIVAYMRTFPAVNKAVKPFEPSGAAKLLFTYVMKPMPHSDKPVVAPPKGATKEYGEYLAWNVAMCGGCHTPRSPNDGSWDMSKPFSGGVFTVPEKLVGFTGSNITPAKSGLGEWSEAQFVTAMRTGARPDGRVLIPAVMPWPAYARWSDDDIKALWLYLQTVEPIEHEVLPTHLLGDAKEATGTPRGEALFDVYCVTCHGPQGKGTPYTNIAQKDAAKLLDDATLKTVVTNGLGVMPGFGKTFDSAQLDDVIAFLRTFAPHDPAAAAAKREPAASEEEQEAPTTEEGT
jgi:mono/diheme cytochrome c family protein